MRETERERERSRERSIFLSMDQNLLPVNNNDSHCPYDTNDNGTIGNPNWCVVGRAAECFNTNLITIPAPLWKCQKTINIWDKHMSRIFMYLIFSHDSPVAHEDARIHKQVHTHVYNSLENSVSTYRYGQNVVIFFCNKTT